jgi:long-subunit fatty acid transport protein
MLSLGASLYITGAQVGGTVAVSACDYAVCTIPEAREWEGRTRFLLGPVYTVSASFGGILDLGRVRVGLSGQLRIFDGVTVENGSGGSDLRASMKVVLPGSLRAGVQVLATRALSLELDTTWERWSVQDSIRIDPKDVFVRNVPTLGTVKAQPVTLARNMRDTVALQLGGQYDLSSLVDRGLFANAGLMVERGSFADEDLSPTTLDTDKVMLALGLSFEVARRFLLDVSYGHLFMRNRQVRSSEVLLPSAIKPTPDDRAAIADGNYAIEADFVGLGMRYLFAAPTRR